MMLLRRNLICKFLLLYFFFEFSSTVLLYYILTLSMILFGRCSFTVFASDGSFHDIEISKDPGASISSAHALNYSSMLKQFPSEICCWDYHPELSLFAIVSSASDSKSTLDGNNGIF